MVVWVSLVSVRCHCCSLHPRGGYIRREEDFRDFVTRVRSLPQVLVVFIADGLMGYDWIYDQLTQAYLPCRDL